MEKATKKNLFEAPTKVILVSECSGNGGGSNSYLRVFSH